MTGRTVKDKDWRYDATVVEVLDGDTVRCSVDLGFKVFMRVDVRVKGINCPEKNTPEGQRAKAASSALMSPGTHVELTTEKPDAADKFGRWLAAVVIPKDGAASQDLAGTLINGGFAKPWDGKGVKPV